MALPVTIPNEFANATASIPLSQLDTNFNTLANAVNGISDGSETLANVTATVANITTANVGALNTSGAVVFNDAGANVDFRVEGDTEANLLFVDASADAVGIGTSSPHASAKLHVYAAGDYTDEAAPFTLGSAATGDMRLYAGVNNTSDYTYIGSVRSGQAYGSLVLQPNGGNVGIGTSSPALAGGDAGRVLQVEDATRAAFRATRTSGGGDVELRAFASSGASLTNNANGQLTFGTNATERMRIDSSGNLLVGTTSVSGVSSASVTAGVFYGTQSVAANTCLQAWNQATSGDNVFVLFYTEGGGGTLRGSITYNRTAGLTSYNTTSDYRAKDISGPVTDSGALIDSVPVYMGKMKGATQERPMFIAHEVPAYAHTGVKDAVDADGKPVYQQMDASALIPVMWAEIQGLRKRLAAANL
jgi:hypothetical protein